MRAARRQHRAIPKPPKAAFTRGIQQAMAALYATEPLSEEQRVAMLRKLEQAPYEKPQGELELPV